MAELDGRKMSFIEETPLGKAYDSVLMRRMWKYLSPHKKLLIISIALLPLVAVFQLIQPYIIKIAIDENIIKGKLEGLNFLALLFMFALGFQYIISFSQLYILQLAGQKISMDLRINIFRHLQKLPASFFDKNPVGRLVTRVTNDVESLNEMFTSGIAGLVGDIFTLLGIIVVMFVLNAKLAVITMMVLPILAITAMIFRLKARDAYRLIRVKLASLNSFLQESLVGVEIVKLFNREEKSLGEFQGLNRGLRKANIKSVKYDALLYAFVEFTGSLAIALIIWYGGGQIVRDVLSFGALVAFIEYAQKFFIPIRDLSAKYAIMQQAMASLERIFMLLDEREEEDLKDSETIKDVKGEIRFEEVSFAYNPGDYVLKDMTFSINPGDKVAVVGATGAGKSTLIKLLNRFYEIDSGKITFDGVDIKRLNKRWLRKQIGIVSQDVFLFSGDIESNIRLGEDMMSQERIEEAMEISSADKFISKLPMGIKEQITEGGKNISAGEKQLLSLARAIAFNPKVLVFDEATSNVDTNTENLIRKALARLKQKKTSITIAHRLFTVRDADKILVLHKGKLRESGSHDELMKTGGIYYRLYKLQMKAQLKISSVLGEEGSSVSQP